MTPEVIAKLVDSRREQRNLYFRAAAIGWPTSVRLYDFPLASGRNGHQEFFPASSFSLLVATKLPEALTLVKAGRPLAGVLLCPGMFSNDLTPLGDVIDEQVLAQTVGASVERPPMVYPRHLVDKRP